MVMQENEWVIKTDEGHYLLSLHLANPVVKAAFYIPDAPLKSNEAKNGPLRFNKESTATAMLSALIALSPSTFEMAVVTAWPDINS